MAIKGYGAGMASIALGVLFLVLLILSMLVPGTSIMSTGAVVVGLGTIISIIFLAVALLAHD